MGVQASALAIARRGPVAGGRRGAAAGFASPASAAVAEPGTLCPGDVGRRSFWLGPPLCACCGLPFPCSRADQWRSRSCSAGGRLQPRAARVSTRARAAFGYDDASKGADPGGSSMPTGLHGAPAFGRWMARGGGGAAGGGGLWSAPCRCTGRGWPGGGPFSRWVLGAVCRVGRLRRPALCGLDLLQRRRRTPQQGELGGGVGRTPKRPAVPSPSARRHLGRGEAERRELKDDAANHRGDAQRTARGDAALLDAGAGGEWMC